MSKDNNYKDILSRFDERMIDAIATSPVQNPAHKSAGYNPSIGNFNPVLGSANADLEPERQTITARARDLWRNNPVANSIITRVLTNAIGTQLKLQAKINHKMLGISKEDADNIANKIESEWELFACKELDESRRYNFPQLCGIIMSSALINGDCFATTPIKKRKNTFNPYTTCVKVLEADRVCNPYNSPDNENLIGGVQIKDDELYSVWVTDQHLGDSLVLKYSWTEVPFFGKNTGRRRVFHLINPNMLRPEQVRGVSFLSIVQNVVKKLQDWTESELTRAKVQSNMGGAFIELADDFGGRALFGNQNQTPIQSAQSRVELYAQNKLRMGEGSILTLLPNDKVTFPPVSSPNAHLRAFTVRF